MNRKKIDFRKISLIFPVLFYLAYRIVYVVIIPKLCGTRLTINNWIFDKPDQLLENLQNPGEDFISEGKIGALKFLLYVLWFGFLASLIYSAWTIQNRRQKYNSRSVLRDREPYLKALQINDKINGLSFKGIKEVKLAVRNVMEHLKNESAFGYGSNAVMECEQEIAKYLKKIEKNIPVLTEEATTEKAKKVVMENCEMIQTQLKIRTERKKR